MNVAPVSLPASAVATAAARSSSSATGSSALASLSNNLGNFLSMLMTQLQNQDPTSPLDTNQFTSELVQFSSVEQQIQTNSSLTQLITLTQAGEVMQGTAMIGKRVIAATDHVPLQNGQGTINFSTPAAAQVNIAITTDAGVKVRDATLSANAGANSWTWDGTDNKGKAVTDGAYHVAVTTADAKGVANALAFTVTGTATGVTSESNAVRLQLGTLGVDFSAVRSVGG